MTFPTPLLDARLTREKQQNEVDRLRILQATTDWLTQNAARYGVKTGYIFGSVTTPDRFTARSDVDLAIETFKVGDVCSLLSVLSTHLNRDVDVVPLDQCHFAPKIRRVGIAWTAKELPDSPLS